MTPVSYQRCIEVTLTAYTSEWLVYGKQLPTSDFLSWVLLLLKGSSQSVQSMYAETKRQRRNKTDASEWLVDSNQQVLSPSGSGTRGTRGRRGSIRGRERWAKEYRPSRAQSAPPCLRPVPWCPEFPEGRTGIEEPARSLGQNGSIVGAGWWTGDRASGRRSHRIRSLVGESRRASVQVVKLRLLRHPISLPFPFLVNLASLERWFWRVIKNN